MIYESELYHHGIKGQKWGVRNGPPYPLDENGAFSKTNRRSVGSEYANKFGKYGIAKIIGTAGAVAVAMTWTVGFMKDKV